ncbi:hypothetical protein HMPREF1866_02737 [Lachnoanaerobaculum saburreum]|uniref:Uncharacterized protein n=1 Tax=Lachnoanaerobaculum saburreum TaxID=467210 RepID=A0A133ZC07_9FIRM|nr:hypothetical protein HMPREF1866_02737 [Lachnoanaerobaculum saburreum]
MEYYCNIENILPSVLPVAFLYLWIWIKVRKIIQISWIFANTFR